MSWSSSWHESGGSSHEGVDDVVWHVGDWVDKHIECLGVVILRVLY